MILCTLYKEHLKTEQEGCGVILNYYVLVIGHYISFVQPQSVLALSQEDMCDLMLEELTTGCVDQPDVKCGFIGEVGSGWPLHGECFIYL
jgi:hypothetical protein